jgi:hypothetical protein
MLPITMILMLTQLPVASDTGSKICQPVVVGDFDDPFQSVQDIILAGS